MSFRLYVVIVDTHVKGELQCHLVANVSFSICWLACEVLPNCLQLISATSQELPAGLSRGSDQATPQAPLLLGFPPPPFGALALGTCLVLGPLGRGLWGRR